MHTNQASIELCRKLFELSLWGSESTGDGQLEYTHEAIPRYTAGYLFHKLPEYCRIHKEANNNITIYCPNGIKNMQNEPVYISPIREEGLENAMCSMLIKLFEADILSRDH